MGYCKYCGKEVESDAVVCIHCGRSLVDKPPVSTDDTGSIGWGVLGFFVPLIGLILFLIWKDEKPKNAKAAGKGALISVILSVVVTVCFLIGTAILASSMEYHILASNF